MGVFFGADGTGSDQGCQGWLQVVQRARFRGREIERERELGLILRRVVVGWSSRLTDGLVGGWMDGSLVEWIG